MNKFLNYIIILLPIQVLVLMINISLFAQSTEKILFESTSLGQWIVQGHVTPLQDGSSLDFEFSFNSGNPPSLDLDSIYITIIGSFDLSNCSSAYVDFEVESILPHEDSWIYNNVEVYVRHEFSSEWYQMTRDLSALGSYVEELEIMLAIAFRTNMEFPGTFRLSDINITGKCS